MKKGGGRLFAFFFYPEDGKVVNTKQKTPKFPASSDTYKFTFNKISLTEACGIMTPKMILRRHTSHSHHHNIKNILQQKLYLYCNCTGTYP